LRKYVGFYAKVIKNKFRSHKI